VTFAAHDAEETNQVVQWVDHVRLQVVQLGHRQVLSLALSKSISPALRRCRQRTSRNLDPHIEMRVCGFRCSFQAGFKHAAVVLEGIVVVGVLENVLILGDHVQDNQAIPHWCEAHS